MVRKKLSRAKRKTVADFLKNQVGLSRRKVRDLFREENNLNFAIQKEKADEKAKNKKNRKTIVVGQRYFKLSHNEGILVLEKKEVTFRERNTIVSFLRSKGYTDAWIGKTLGMKPNAVQMSMVKEEDKKRWQKRYSEKNKKGC